MIGLDTNILVRYLAQDDPVQSRQATRIIERHISARNPGFISIVALAETAWVLKAAFDFNGREIAATIEALLQSEALIVQFEQEVFTATVAVKENRGSFADALNAALGNNAGCAHTSTLDKKAARLEGFANP